MRGGGGGSSPPSHGPFPKPLQPLTSLWSALAWRPLSLSPWYTPGRGGAGEAPPLGGPPRRRPHHLQERGCTWGWGGGGTGACVGGAEAGALGGACQGSAEGPVCGRVCWGGRRGMLCQPSSLGVADHSQGRGRRY